jgi:hypothetical protein
LFVVAATLISAALALLSWNMEYKVGIVTPGRIAAEIVFPIGQHNSILGYIALRIVVDWIFWFVAICGLFWLVGALFKRLFNTLRRKAA